MVDATIDVLDRGRLECDANYFVEGYRFSTYDEPDPDAARIEIPVYSLVIDHPEATILWDTGSHHDAGERWPEPLRQAFYPVDAHEHRLDDDLEAAGYALEEIDAVLATHLHVDHAGGLAFFDGTDVPVFVHEAELKHAYYAAATGGDYLRSDFDHELNWRVVHGERETRFEDVEFLHLPGHTPGLLGTVVHLETDTIVFTGDEAYLAENYRDERPLGGPLLWSKPHWAESLRRVKAIERRHDAEVVLGHDPERFEAVLDGWG